MVKYLQLNTDMPNYRQRGKYEFIWEIPSLFLNSGERIALSSCCVSLKPTAPEVTRAVKMYLNVIEEDIYNSDGMIAAARFNKGKLISSRQILEFWKVDSGRPRDISIRFDALDTLDVTDIQFARFVFAME